MQEERTEWLKELAKDRAQAEIDPDWESKMKRMVATAEDRAINRKLTAVTKGVHHQLDRTEIPEHDWYLSPSNNELYHIRCTQRVSN